MVEYQITQLTDNDLVETVPQISGNNIVWTANDGNDDEIFFYDGATIEQLTNDDLFDIVPNISGNNIVWTKSSSNISENPFADSSIYLYDGSSTIELDNGGSVLLSTISGNNVAWGSVLNGDIFYYDGSDTTKIDDSAIAALVSSSISENNLVWTGVDGSDVEIFLYDGNTTIQLTDNNSIEALPLVSGNNVVWTGNVNATGDLNSAEIYFYNGSETIQLTDNNLTDLATSISGNNAVWIGNDGNDNEIFLYNGNTTIQLTNNDTDDLDPFVSGDNVIWEGNDGNDGEIFLYNGSETIQLTDNEIDDANPSISGNNIVWEADGDIFLATPTNTNSEPDSTALTLTGGTAQIAYVAYYGRPADISGLNFWNDALNTNGINYAPRAGDTLTGNEQVIYNDIVNQFGNSAEADRLFGSIDNNRGKVNQVYQFVFNRDGDAAGLEYWTEQIDLGNVTLATFALEIALGAQNDDIVVLNHKIESANLFSNSINTQQEIEAYSGFSGESFGREWLDSFGDITSTQAQVDSALTDLVSDGF